jgi:Tfp pilus assembly protein FimT
MVEIVVGVQLCVILALLAAPSFSQILQLYYLRGASRAIFADLQKARMAAVMENHRYRLTVVDSHTYKVHGDTNNNGAEDPGESVTTRNVQGDSPHVQLAGTDTITFAANGTAPTSGTITVSNERGPTGSMTVAVSPAGRVRIN